MVSVNRTVHRAGHESLHERGNFPCVNVLSKYSKLPGLSELSKFSKLSDVYLRAGLSHPRDGDTLGLPYLHRHHPRPRVLSSSSSISVPVSLRPSETPSW